MENKCTCKCRIKEESHPNGLFPCPNLSEKLCRERKRRPKGRWLTYASNGAAVCPLRTRSPSENDIVDVHSRRTHSFVCAHPELERHCLPSQVRPQIDHGVDVTVRITTPGHPPRQWVASAGKGKENRVGFSITFHTHIIDCASVATTDKAPINTGISDI